MKSFGKDAWNCLIWKMPSWPLSATSGSTDTAKPCITSDTFVEFLGFHSLLAPLNFMYLIMPVIGHAVVLNSVPI
jgi:hypothetical protein